MNLIKGEEGASFWLRWPKRNTRKDARRGVQERKSWWVLSSNSPEHESDNLKCRMTNSMNEASLENDTRQDNKQCSEHEDTVKEVGLTHTTNAPCSNGNGKGKRTRIFLNIKSLDCLCVGLQRVG